MTKTTLIKTMATAEDSMLSMLHQIKQDLSTYSEQDRLDISACAKDEAFEVGVIAGEIVDILQGRTS